MLSLFIFGWSIAADAGPTAGVLLNWNPPVDADTNANISQYFISYGTAPGLYTNLIAITSATYISDSGGYVIQNLPEGPTYYFVVAAVDTDGNSSTISTPVSLALPIPQPVNMQPQYYYDGNGAFYAMTLSWTNSTVTKWYFESSSNLVNWTITDGDNDNDPGQTLLEVVYYDPTVPQTFYRVVDY